MKKFSKKFILIVLLNIIIFFSNIVFASTLTIEQKKQEATPISIEEGNLSKKITKVDQENKEITIQLKLNITKDKTIRDDTEIIFLIDNSQSMQTKLGENITRKQKVVASTKELINKINKNNPNAKMGIVSFAVKGESVQPLTNNSEEILKSCETFGNLTCQGATNMVAGITAAKQSFSATANDKVLILLTDGIPTDDKNAVSQNLVDPNTYIITTLVGLESESESEKAIIESIFGTEENPVADKFYNISDKDIETTISNNIYGKILNSFQGVVTNIEIKDYFPKEIIDNFDIEIKNKTKGQANKDENSISWKIDELKSGENAVLEYVLKLKDGYDKNIENKDLNTNEKVELNYNDMNRKENQKQMLDTPKILLNVKESDNKTTQVKNKNDNTNNNINNNINNNTENKLNTDNTVLKGSDSTTANKILANTGKEKSIILLVLLILIVTETFFFVANKKANIKK